MRTILLLFMVTLVTYCDKSSVDSEGKRFISSGRDHQNSEDSKITKLKHRTAAESRNNDLILSKYISERNPGRRTARALHQNNVVMKKREAVQIFNGISGRALSKRQVLKDVDGNSTWTNGVFYTFNTSDHVIQKFFKMGAKLWSDATCVDFVEDKNAPDKVVVFNEQDTYSDIGKMGGDQALSLDDDSFTEGSAAHEIGHTLGLFHTMSRYDRDNYIIIEVQNVKQDQLDEFRKLDSSEIDVYGLTYDYGSIMHYQELSCSTNLQPALIARDPRHQKTMGSEIISFSDIFMINEHYGCNARCNVSTSAKCANEGYPHPRNCSICICPSGYGGALCDRRPPGCGQDLVATSEKQILVSRVGSGRGLRDQFDFCNYMITAPEGKKIEAEVQPISGFYDEGGCPRGGVEVKTQKDQKLTGYRFCSKMGSGGPIISSSNILPVILFNRLSVMRANITYRYID